MRLLLDTNALIWLLNGDEQLSCEAKAAIEDESNMIFVSAVSVFEMAVKIRIGKLKMDLSSAVARIDESDIERLDIRDKHCLAMASIVAAPGHRDPFDLMLVAQAMTEDMTLVSSDHMLEHYPVNVLPCATGNPKSA